MKRETILLKTRLGRNVFSAGNIPPRMMELLVPVLEENHVRILEYRFFPDAFVATASMPDGMTADRLGYLVRMATSAPLRKEFQELWKMPSLWGRRVAVLDLDASQVERVPESL